VGDQQLVQGTIKSVDAQSNRTELAPGTSVEAQSRRAAA
jgi:hypothetical protein